MKKIIVFILSFVLILLSAFSASADSFNTDDKTEDSFYIKGNYSPDQSTINVYSVDITWQDMRFAFSYDSKYWDIYTLSYKYQGARYNYSSHNTITVTNNSNVGISVTPSTQFQNGASFKVCDSYYHEITDPIEVGAYPNTYRAYLYVNMDNYPFTDKNYYQFDNITMGTVTLNISAAE